MKIRVITSDREYQGLYKGSVYEVSNAFYSDDRSVVVQVLFNANGKLWSLCQGEFEVLMDGHTPVTPPTKDMVNSPSHYALFDDIEAIQVIASSMTKEMFKGYCFGNLLKYKLRAGGKDDIQQELKKAERYKGLYEEYQHLCKQN